MPESVAVQPVALSVNESPFGRLPALIRTSPGHVVATVKVKGAPVTAAAEAELVKASVGWVVVVIATVVLGADVLGTVDDVDVDPERSLDVGRVICSCAVDVVPDRPVPQAAASSIRPISTNPTFRSGRARLNVPFRRENRKLPPRHPL